MHYEHEKDTLAFTHQLYAETPRQLAFQATTSAAAEAWQLLPQRLIPVLKRLL